jgi:hypothetical protein
MMLAYCTNNFIRKVYVYLYISSCASSILIFNNLLCPIMIILKGILRGNAKVAIYYYYYYYIIYSV